MRRESIIAIIIAIASAVFEIGIALLFFIMQYRIKTVTEPTMTVGLIVAVLLTGGAMSALIFAMILSFRKRRTKLTGKRKEKAKH